MVTGELYPGFRNILSGTPVGTYTKKKKKGGCESLLSYQYQMQIFFFFFFLP
jgi:hypothetical protein